MKIDEVKVLSGPNFWSVRRHKLIQVLLDLEEMEELPTNKIPGFYERITTLIPSLFHHECSEGKPGGFFSRVKDGTWMGHVMEHIALEIQSLAGIPVGFGRTRGTGKEGMYHMVFEYGEKEEGIYAASAALRIVQALVKGEEYNLQNDIDEIKKLWYARKLGPSTSAIVEEAMQRNIPYLRLDEDALVQLGYGCKQKRIEATIAATTSSIAVELVGDKDRTKKLLTAAHIPVPYGIVISDVEKLRDFVEEEGFPLVMKPLQGNHGKGATININTWNHAMVAFERAKKFSEKIIVEKFIKGYDYRILVINYKFVAAALRTPAYVTGDGKHTINELIEITNADPARGDNHDNILTRIEVNDVTLELLHKKRYALDTVLPEGKICFLKPTANLSTGGTSTDVTDDVHPSNISLFERIARTMGLDICGIDIMAPDLQTPLSKNGGAVLEVNAAPGFRMHLQPSAGKPRNVAAPVIDMLFNDSGRIPIVAITGTNGKTTTTRLVSHIAKEAGYVTGMTTTDGIYINNELIFKGDCSGPKSAESVLRDPSVEFAVLETARGGLLRSGLAFDQCDTAIITNVAEDHLGMDGIHTLDQLTKVKSIVAEAASSSGYAVLNADDDRVYSMKDRVKSKVALFSMYSDNIRIEEHCNNGGIAAVYENGYVLIRTGNHILPVEEVENIPITFGGKADFNIANVLAAALGAYTTGISLNKIREALKTFIPSSENTPGRANIFEFNDFTVMVDYAHNPHGVKALGNFINSFNTANKVGIITGVGDRRDEDIISLGQEAARIFNEIIIRHDEDLRGRTHEELDTLLTNGVRKVNPNIPVSYFWCECESVDYAIRTAKPDTLIVVLTDNILKVTSCIREHQEKRVNWLKKAV